MIRTTLSLIIAVASLVLVAYSYINYKLAYKRYRENKLHKSLEAMIKVYNDYRGSYNIIEKNLHYIKGSVEEYEYFIGDDDFNDAMRVLHRITHELDIFAYSVNSGLYLDEDILYIYPLVKAIYNDELKVFIDFSRKIQGNHLIFINLETMIIRIENLLDRGVLEL